MKHGYAMLRQKVINEDTGSKGTTLLDPFKAATGFHLQCLQLVRLYY